MLGENSCLLSNHLEQDQNGTRIASACKLMRSLLRFKKSITEHCRQFNADPFLLGDGWKTARNFEEISRETSRLTMIFQN